MSAINLSPSVSDNMVHLLRKLLVASNLSLGIAPGQSVEVSVDGSTVSVVGGAVQNSGGFSTLIQLPLVGAAAAYVAGDRVGGVPGLTTLFRAGQRSAILQSVAVIDQSGKAPELSIMIGKPNTFNQAVADNAAFSWGSQPQNLMALVNVVTDDYTTIDGVSMAMKSGLGIVLRRDTYIADTLLAVAAASGFTPTVASGISLQLGILQD